MNDHPPQYKNMILNENDVQKRRVDKKRMQERIKEEYRNEKYLVSKRIYTMEVIR